MLIIDTHAFTYILVQHSSNIQAWKMAFFHVPTWWSNIHGPILKKIKNQSTKSFSPSLGVNQKYATPVLYGTDSSYLWCILVQSQVVYFFSCRNLL